MHHSGGRWNSALDGWMLTGVPSTNVLYPSVASGRQRWLQTASRTLFSSIAEEARTDSHANPVVIGAARDQVVFVSVHDTDKLWASAQNVGVFARLALSHVLCGLHRTRVDEVFKAPGVGELGRLPTVVDSLWVSGECGGETHQ